MTRVFQVIAVKKDKEGNVTEILTKANIIAESERNAELKLVVSNPDIFTPLNMDEVEILVRPFK